MDAKKRMNELLVKTGAYKDLEKPVILASGELGIYFINAEKLCMDGGEFEKFGDDSEAMAKHAFEMMKGHNEFDEVISILADEAGRKLSESDGFKAISGGQRRDWLFSAPVAVILDLPHISLYKDGKKDLLFLNKKIDMPLEVRDYNIVHVVDMITEGSSIYRTEGDTAKGWVPMIRSMSSNPDSSIKNVLAVVTRNQGGEENLAKQGVDVTSFVSIDEAFLKAYSSNPDRAVKYFRNPKQWSEDFLYNHEVDCLVKFFDPKGKSLDKAKKFMKRYGEFMEDCGALTELQAKVNKAYNVSLNEIVGGR